MIERLRDHRGQRIKAMCVVHNETSTGVTSDIAAVRRAIDAAGHPALLTVDTISGLASADYRHDEWGVDVTVSGSQKGLMLPPGISFNALSPKAIAVSQSATLPKAVWAWDEIVEMNQTGYWPYTPNTNLLYGLGKLKGRMFRIGHLGDCNDLTLMAALSGVEMGLRFAGVRLAGSGVAAAMDYFAATPQPRSESSALLN